MRKEINKIINTKWLQLVNLVFNILIILSLLICTQCINYIINNLNNDKIPKMTVIILFTALVFYIASYFIGPLLYRLMVLKANTRLHNKLVKKLINTDLSFYRENDSGYIAQITNDVCSEVSSYYATFNLNLIINLLTLLGYFGLLFYYSWKIGLIVLFSQVMLMIATKKVVDKQINAFKIYRNKQPKVTSKLLDYVDNIYIIKNLNQNYYFEKEYENNYLENYYKPVLKFKILDSIYTGLYAVILYVLPLIILVLGITFNDILGISLGATVSAYAILGNLQEPIRGLSGALAEYKKNKTNIEVLQPLLVKEEKVNVENIRSFNKLSFSSRGLKFDSKVILKDIDFVVNKGDFVLIKGISGAGKSTIFKLLTKEITNDNVLIEINNKNFINLNINNLIYYVNQNSRLFKTNVIDNICCGFTPSDFELNEVIHVCELDSFIEKYGFYKEVDSISSNISGGEISRIALARILIRKPQIVLLDEITSALDHDTSLRISKKIYEYCQKYNITALTISHKDEFNCYANKVIELS